GFAGLFGVHPDPSTQFLYRLHGVGLVGPTGRRHYQQSQQHPSAQHPSMSHHDGPFGKKSDSTFRNHIPHHGSVFAPARAVQRIPFGRSYIRSSTSLTVHRRGAWQPRTTSLSSLEALTL